MVKDPRDDKFKIIREPVNPPIVQKGLPTLEERLMELEKRVKKLEQK